MLGDKFLVVGRGGWSRWLVAVVGLLGWVQGAGAQESISTTNSDKLTRFWQLLESKARPVRILSFGDSVADSYRSPTFHLFDRLAAKFGAAGYSFNNYRNTLGIALTNGAQLTEPDQFWFNRYFTLPPSAAVWWEKEWVPGGNRCDVAGLFYVAHPQGGIMTLSVSTNAGPWTNLLILDCYSPTPAGRFTNVMLAPNPSRVQAQSLTGTNLVLGPLVEMTQTNGVHISFMDYGGLPLSAVTNVARSIRDPIMAALKPDLIVWHMKENAPWLSLSNQLHECEDWWRGANPAGEVLYIGTTWTVYDLEGTLDLDQNRTVRGVAVANQRAYVDLMTPTVSYQWLSAQGWIPDGVHLTSAGGQWCANLMWDDLGFFALGLPRRVDLQRNGEGWQAVYATATGATYRVQSSSNLSGWTTLSSVPGDGQSKTNALPAGTNGFIRLSLKPAG